MATETSSVELIEFVRPCGNANNLYITNISKDINEEEAQVCEVAIIFYKSLKRSQKIEYLVALTRSGQNRLWRDGIGENIAARQLLFKLS